MARSATKATDTAPGTWTPEITIVVVGLTIGWTLGIAGGVVQEGSGRYALWGISSIGILIAAALLTIRYAASNVMFSAGLALLLVGEAVIHTQGTAGVDAFASATFAYAPGLLLVALSGWGPRWTRITALAAAAVFAVHAARYLSGSDAGPDHMIPTIGYVFFILTMIGWTWHLTRPPRTSSDAAPI